MLELDRVSRTYGEGPTTVHALREVSLEIAANSLTTIVGSSGSGKSTLLNLMGALDRPSQGEVRIAGQALSTLDDAARTRLRRDRIGFVFQFFNLLPTLTAVENAALPARLAGWPAKRCRQRASELLEQVGLAERLDHHPDALSGGEMQRVAVARALMMDPPLVLADEPTGNLDSASGTAVLSLLRDAVGSNRTIVLVTHDSEVAALGDRRIVMADGRVVEDTADARPDAAAAPTPETAC